MLLEKKTTTVCIRSRTKTLHSQLLQTCPPGVEITGLLSTDHRPASGGKRRCQVNTDTVYVCHKFETIKLQHNSTYST
jgi:hypothetical protein